MIEQIEDGELLSKAIASLPGKYREVLLMKYARGYSMDEIAEILSMSKENVKKTIQRARKKLSDYFNVIKLKFLPNTKKHPPRLI